MERKSLMENRFETAFGPFMCAKDYIEGTFDGLHVVATLEYDWDSHVNKAVMDATV